MNIALAGPTLAERHAQAGRRAFAPHRLLGATSCDAILREHGRRYEASATHSEGDQYQPPPRIPCGDESRRSGTATLVSDAPNNRSLAAAGCAGRAGILHAAGHGTYADDLAAATPVPSRPDARGGEIAAGRVDR